MADKAVVDTIESFLELNWAATPIIGTNTAGTAPSDGSPFLRVEYPFARSEQVTIGAPGQNLFREEGAFRIVIMVTRGSGDAQALTWASTIAALFRGKLIGAVETFAPTVFPGGLEGNGNFAGAAVVVPYTFDLFG